MYNYTDRNSLTDQLSEFSRSENLHVITQQSYLLSGERMTREDLAVAVKLQLGALCQESEVLVRENKL